MRWLRYPLGGNVYIFRGRRGDLVKILWATEDGIWLLAKRLEQSRFIWPQADGGKVHLSSAQLSMLLEGIDWRHPRRTVALSMLQTARQTRKLRRMSNGADLPDDVELLKALLVEARSLLAERDVEIEQLKAQIDKLRRMQFGRKSEQLQRQIETLETQLEDLAAGRGVADVARAQARGANASSSNATTDKTASRQALPAHLSRENHVLEPESSFPDCGQQMQVLGEDVSEQLARVAAAFKVVRTIRRKFVCPCCSTIRQPPMPGLPIERSIAHPSLLADILVSKYADHQPLYR